MKLRALRRPALFGLVVVALVVVRPARLESLRWWRSPRVVSSLHLTASQTASIDRIYQENLAARRRCVERSAQTALKVGQMVHDGEYDEVLRDTETLAGLAAEDETLRRRLRDRIVAILSPDQRDAMARLVARRVVE